MSANDTIDGGSKSASDPTDPSDGLPDRKSRITAELPWESTPLSSDTASAEMFNAFDAMPSVGIAMR